MQTPRVYRRIPVALSTVVIAIAMFSISSRAQTLTTLHDFRVGEGKEPGSSLALAGGAFYGVLSAGGSGFGSVYKFSNGSLTILHSFTEKGPIPPSNLLADAAGNIYGVAYFGGTHASGMVYKVDPGGNFSVLYNFCSTKGCLDGQYPNGGLAIDAAGNLYGTATSGGSSGWGTVFRLAPDGQETVLYNFCSVSENCPDGRNPQAPVIVDTAGNVYGSTFNGGTDFYGYGVVFKVDPSGVQTVLHTFSGWSDGAFPDGSLIRDRSGNLYGVTYEGGNGPGVVFKLDTSGTLTVLYNLCSEAKCSDGAQPQGGLLRSPDGSFYGSASTGGDENCNPPIGCGTVFKLTSTGVFTVLHTFHYEDGAAPLGNLIMGSGGTLFGVTYLGGNISNIRCIAPEQGLGCGTIFEINP